MSLDNIVFRNLQKQGQKWTKNEETQVKKVKQ